MIVPVDNHYVISSRGAWRPGAYDTQRAARYAQRLSDEQLQRLQDSVNPDGVITFEMLQAERRSAQ